MNLKYKPMEHVTQAKHFIYNIPKVYHDSLNFNWRERDYLIASEDCHYLRNLNSQIKNGQITIPGNQQGQASITIAQNPLTEDDFECFIDVMEKIVLKTKSKVEKSLLDNFFIIGEDHLKEKLNRAFITRCLIPYWKQGRDQKKRVTFIRKFWENPDSNDADATAAFKKRNDHNKM